MVHRILRATTRRHSTFTEVAECLGPRP
jgi:hypothetical protein